MVSGPEWNVSSADKVLFPADDAEARSISKLEVVDHYRRVGDAMIQFCYGRPLTVQRFPKGITAKGFMQKNAADHFPASIRRLPVPKRGGGQTLYPVVTEADDLAWLANQNTVAFHMWTSSADLPGRPDWLVLDLDPEADDIDGGRDATLTIRSVLQRFGLDGFPVATGSKGFHVWVPVTGVDFGQASLVTRAIAGLAVTDKPETLTTEFLKRNRNGRVFVDWLRNGPTATVVVPFSLRPRPGAPMVTPLTWAELPTALPDDHHIGFADDRFEVAEEALGLPGQAVPVDHIAAEARAAGIDLDTPHDRFGRR